MPLPSSKRTLRHRLNRLFRRRGALPRTARLPRPNYDPHYRRGAFGRTKFGRFEMNFSTKRWLGRVALAALVMGAIWVVWQSWIGLRVFGN